MMIYEAARIIHRAQWRTFKIASEFEWFTLRLFNLIQISQQIPIRSEQNFNRHISGVCSNVNLVSKPKLMLYLMCTMGKLAERHSTRPQVRSCK